MTAAKVVRFSFFFMGGGVLIDFRGGCVLFRGSWVFFFGRGSAVRLVYVYS